MVSRLNNFVVDQIKCRISINLRLYPVDKTRLDDGNTEELETTNQPRKAVKENKKTK